MDNTRGHETKIRYEYGVEYAHMPIMLSDGLSYSREGTVVQKDSKLKKFTYELTDHTKNHSIILMNKKGNQDFYGVVTKNQS